LLCASCPPGEYCLIAPVVKPASTFLSPLKLHVGVYLAEPTSTCQGNYWGFRVRVSVAFTWVFMKLFIVERRIRSQLSSRKRVAPVLLSLWTFIGFQRGQSRARDKGTERQQTASASDRAICLRADETPVTFRAASRETSPCRCPRCRCLHLAARRNGGENTVKSAGTHTKPPEEDMDAVQKWPS